MTEPDFEKGIEDAEKLILDLVKLTKKTLLSIKTNNPVTKAEIENIMIDINDFIEGKGVSINKIKNKIGTLYWKLDVSISDDPSEREYREKYSYYREHDDDETIKQNVKKLYEAYKLLSKALGIALFGA